MSLTIASVQANVNSCSLYGVYQPSRQWTFKGLLGYGNFNLNSTRSIA